MRTGRVGAAAAALALTLAGCAARPSSVTQAPYGASAEPPPRRPDGVVLEPPPAMPSSSLQADARGVVALRVPVSAEAVRDCVEALLLAWQGGSLDGLTALLAPDAGPLEARARGAGPLVEGWRSRLRAREYRRLEGLELARLDRVERYAYADLGGPDAPARPPDMRTDETLVRVPLEVTQLGGERYFGDVLVLLVRGHQGRARIVAYGETP